MSIKEKLLHAQEELKTEKDRYKKQQLKEDIKYYKWFLKEEDRVTRRHKNNGFK